MEKDLPVPGSGWTLFLDRDGVINRRLPGEYVRSWPEFEFLEGVLSALAALRPLFNRIIVITNQQGIGKRLMTEEDLQGIHALMTRAVCQAGGHLDAIYFCPALAAPQPNCRKPFPAMGLEARRDFPDIEFQRAIMVGDSRSDMEFGKNLGMWTVLGNTKDEEGSWWMEEEGNSLVDEIAESLAGWTEVLLRRIAGR